MENIIFQTSAHAKCILAGEHSVLQGFPAIILPVTTKQIILNYQNKDHTIEVDCRSIYGEMFLLFFWKTFRKSLQLINKNLSDVRGQFFLENDIEIGAGIGFSAALCVVITRWIIWEHWLKEKKLFHFASRLEDIFHGKSSGVDVAGAMTNHILHFEKSGDIHTITMRWQPKIYLSYSGQIKHTMEAVNHVNHLRKKNPALAKDLDLEMQESVLMIENALSMDENRALPMLVSAIQHARYCFERWGLISPELQQHFEDLYELGAIAVKPTGAGIGGYVLSLWEKEPPTNSKIKFISVF